MPNHRVSPGSLSVADLLEASEIHCPSTHRAETLPTVRFKAVAGVAIAAGALLTTGAHLSPAIAEATPLAPADEDPVNTAEPVSAPAQVAPAAAVSTPFGLVGLPPEVAAPLAQAEQTIKDLQQQWLPAVQAAIPALPPAPALPAVPAIPAPAPLTIERTVLPVQGGQISSGFGGRWGAFHYGVDIADPIGTPIHSVRSGTVLDAGPAQGFGQWVRVKQDDGTIAVYGHVNDMYVSRGDRVDVGEVIASVGNRGDSTGPHLHLEIWGTDGVRVDPVVWLQSKGVLMQQHWGAD
ncbi:M23 family metallopeptidase [Nocardia acidivorans]|uniref:M23 family metallopeptidase n=1 Tax=Nocardia acidivorans TaxID=404580 RepID=UPI000A072ED6|nr:M23 family metallopeptidase [Nocardia acidivorans]